MSQWAGIESDAVGSRRGRSDVRSPDVAGSVSRSGPATDSVRLRRQEHIVFGSIDRAAHLMQRHGREVIV
ncbi:MAG: hypothetical protein ABIR12_06080, partial [Ilumatobacteraceae bacterium]